MYTIAFSKLIPGGNPTLLLPDPDLHPGALTALSARLMEPLHVHAEQVGALYSPERAVALPGMRPGLAHLQMMGGEFCVNATRCAAMLLAGQGVLTGLAGKSDVPGQGKTSAGESVFAGALTVSGMHAPVEVLTAPDVAAFDAALARRLAGDFSLAPGNAVQGTALSDRYGEMYCAARVGCSLSEVSLEHPQEGVVLANLPGIQHLLVDTALHTLPDMRGAGWREASATWRSACGLTGSPASGVVWYERRETGCRIWPAVEVTACGSEHLESACGSASLVLALLLHQGASAQNVREGIASFSITQPSGESLRVLLEASRETFPDAAWIAGTVRLVASGVAYV